MEEMTVETALGVDGDGDVIMVDAAEAVETNLDGPRKKTGRPKGSKSLPPEEVAVIHDQMKKGVAMSRIARERNLSRETLRGI